jgi:hypothetical protein
MLVSIGNVGLSTTLCPISSLARVQWPAEVSLEELMGGTIDRIVPQSIRAAFACGHVLESVATGWSPRVPIRKVFTT